MGRCFPGETGAALEYLSEQLPGALDLCRLIEEKLLLERELAERERLAVLGQMAASISHNLKNPLGSMKTILQVQLEIRRCQKRCAAKQRWCLRDQSSLSEVETVAAIQPACRARWSSSSNLRRARRNRRSVGIIAP